MIRQTILALVCSGLAIYAWKDWYKSLCGLIVLMAVIEHPDMPKTLLGIQGLNPWNLVFLSVVFSWIASRGREGLHWDMPRHVTMLLLAYLFVVFVGFYRMMADRSGIPDATTNSLYSEYLINSIKWTIPGLLLFDGCRSRSRFILGLSSLLAVYFLICLQVIRWMPASAAISGEGLSARSLKILVNEIGYHRVNLSMMLGGASWAVFAARPLANSRKQGLLILGASLIILYSQALTAGRAGYATWAGVGLILCSIRWRKYLLLAPVAVLLITLLVPGAVDRMMQGFTPETRDRGPNVPQALRLAGDYDEGRPDEYTITAGRNIAWPFVIEKIGESPVFGYGRLAMQRTGISSFLWNNFRESFTHPHNAYLEILLDNGWMGLILVIPFYLVVLKRSISLFRDSRSSIFVVIGGITCSLVLALLLAGVGSQTFYPREGAVGMWCAIGLMLRVSVERSRTFQSDKCMKQCPSDVAGWVQAA